ncbi:hypothetical protein Bbelb_385200 [Branchiostoma belcheri]|nr:hypothetical protein Bbelb_385200 [Branchiostoma belcheri]
MSASPLHIPLTSPDPGPDPENWHPQAHSQGSPGCHNDPHLVPRGVCKVAGYALRADCARRVTCADRGLNPVVSQLILWKPAERRKRRGRKSAIIIDTLKRDAGLINITTAELRLTDGGQGSGEKNNPFLP